MQTIIALDFSDKKDVKNFLSYFSDEKLFLKVGMELFFSQGADIVKYLKDLGHKVFLDLKLNDISNTVAMGVRALSKLNVDMLSIHSLGGDEMMKAVSLELSNTQNPPLIFGISVLTSFDLENLQQIGINQNIEEYMINRAIAMQKCGFNGSVCSVWESLAIKEKLGDGFLTLCPGIRVFMPKNDQKRVATYQDALNQKADFIVIGREITKSENPKLAYEKIINLNKN